VAKAFATPRRTRIGAAWSFLLSHLVWDDSLNDLHAKSRVTRWGQTLSK
jgi:hypothetical protein